MIAKERRKGKKPIDETAKANRKEIKLTDSMVFSINHKSENQTLNMSITGQNNLGDRQTSGNLTQKILSDHKTKSLPKGIRLISSRKVNLYPDISPTVSHSTSAIRHGTGREVPHSGLSASESKNKNPSLANLAEMERDRPVVSAFTMRSSFLPQTAIDFDSTQDHSSRPHSRQVKNTSTIINLLRKNVHRDRMVQPVKNKLSIKKMLFPRSTDLSEIQKEGQDAPFAVINANGWSKDQVYPNQLGSVMKNQSTLEHLDSSLALPARHPAKTPTGNLSHSHIRITSKADNYPSTRNPSAKIRNIDTSMRQNESEIQYSQFRSPVAQTVKSKKSNQLRSLLSSALSTKNN